MIITIKKNADQREVDTLISSLEAKGVKAVEIKGSEFNVYGLTGDTSIIDEKSIKAYHCVENVVRVAAKYKLANRMFHPEDTVIDVNGIRIGGQENIVVIGGPCAVENHDMIVHLAQEVKDAGAKMLRGGAYKPRTSPYSFQGMRTEGILAMVDAREKSGLPIVTELMGEAQIEEFEQYVDIIQIGARNMQNFDLLKEVGRTKKPILLKRGLANTLQELLMSAEYIMSEGNENVILCERGVRTFETYTRNTLDLSAVPVLHELSHLPVVVDPSHATGKARLVPSMACAAAACGADGLMIEVHNDPEHALCDGAQSLTPGQFADVSRKVMEIREVMA